MKFVYSRADLGPPKIEGAAILNTPSRDLEQHSFGWLDSHFVLIECLAYNLFQQFWRAREEPNVCLSHLAIFSPME